MASTLDHLTKSRGSRWFGIGVGVLLVLFVVDDVTTILGALHGLAEENRLILWFRPFFGIYGAQMVFDLVRLAAVLVLVNVYTSTQRKWRFIAITALCWALLLLVLSQVGNIWLLVR